MDRGPEDQVWKWYLSDQKTGFRQTTKGLAMNNARPFVLFRFDPERQLRFLAR
jgi:hypothetical protein